MLSSGYAEIYLACIEFIEYGTKLRYTLLVGNNLYVASCPWWGKCVRIIDRYY